MVIVDTRVDDRDDDIAVAGCLVPSLNHIDIGVRGAARLSEIVKPPHFTGRKPGIVGRQCGFENIVGFGVADVGILLVERDGLFDGHTAAQFDDWLRQAREDYTRPPKNLEKD